MFKYLFIFGNHPLLSLAELEAVMALVSCGAQILLLTDGVAEVRTKNELKLDWWQKRLGGTVKIAKIRIQNSEKNLENSLVDICQPDKNKKFIFGISVYNIDGLNVNKVGMTVKRRLTDSGIKTRFVVGREKVLSSVIVGKNKLITDGGEFILVKNKSDIVIATTETIQDFEAFGERDFGRPAADAKNGMLPPKLAKIMVNLAMIKERDILVDPFCGSGTVLQEALLMSYENVYGHDINEKAVANTIKNIKWLADKNNLNLDGVLVTKADATKLSSQYQLESLNAIVTEPYLGPVDKSNVYGKQDEVINQIEKTYNIFIGQVKNVLKRHGRLVIVVPIIMGKVFDYKKALIENGFKELFPDNKSVDSAKYARRNQRVERLIVVAELR